MRLLFRVLSFLLFAALTMHASNFTLCPGAAAQGGFGNSFTSAASGGACSTSVTMSITSATDYAKLTWNSSSTGYPPGLTVGQLTNMNAIVHQTGPNNPFYMFAFIDASNSLGQTAATDQILFIQFQSSTVSGINMPFSNTTSLFNLYDNDTGVYLQGGQSDTHTLAGWIGLYPFLSSKSLDEIRIGIGLGGGAAPGGSLQVDSVTGATNVPEPGSSALLASGLIGLAGVMRRKLHR